MRGDARTFSPPLTALRFAAGRRGSAASADDDRPRGPNLVNKQAVLPFVPPAFPNNAPDRLLKPSEYLKTITAPCKRDDSAAEPRPPPPPPVPSDNVPPPPPQPPAAAPTQPLAAISSAELSAVRLRSPATKTLSAPPARSVSLQCLPSAAENYRSAKTDLIEELKMSKDITGIKKMKVERARRESLQDKETFTEFTKRFTAENFVDQVSVSLFLISCYSVCAFSNIGRHICVDFMCYDSISVKSSKRLANIEMRKQSRLEMKF